MSLGLRSTGVAFAIMASSALLVSCVKDKPNAPVSKKKAETQIAEKPEVTPLSYEFRIRDVCTGYCPIFAYSEKCETAQSFESAEALCIGLTDRQLNQGCAKDERAEEFAARQCAGSFEEINVGGETYSGEDLRVGQCSYSIPLTTGSEYCKALKEESIHQYCGWEQRRLSFKQYNCEGSFSDLPDSMSVYNEEISELNGELEYEVKSSITYKSYRKLIRFNSGRKNKVEFRDFRMKEDNCEALGKAKITIALSEINPLTGSVSNPSVKSVLGSGETITVVTEKQYIITVELLNPGLCQDMEFGFTLEQIGL